MSFYLSIIVGATLFAVAADLEKRKDKVLTNLSWFISFLLLALPLALRGIGVDYERYQIMYLYSATPWSQFWQSYTYQPEPLYMVLNYVARWTFDSFQGVNVLCALITVGFTYAGLYYYKETISLGLSVWTVGFTYYIMMYGLNRIMIAIGIIMWAFHYWLERKTVKFIIWIAIAGLFHYSAFLMIPFYLINLWMESRTASVKTINWIKVIIGVVLIFLIVYRVVPALFGSYPWFVRYKKYFQLTINMSAINNHYMTYPIIAFAVIYRNRLKYYWKDIDIINPLYLYIILIAVSVIFPVSRIIYLFYPYIVILNGSITTSSWSLEDIQYRSNNHIIQNNLIYYCSMIMLGLFSIWMIVCNSGNWAPFINPYKLWF